MKSLQLKNFRNQPELTLSLFDNHLFTGPNGSGKTSILESIFFALKGFSFRETQPLRLITKNHSEALITLEISIGSEVQKTHWVRFLIGEKGGLSLDGVPLKKFGDFFGIFPVFYFGQESTDFFKKGPQGRRRFLDSTCASGFPDHYHHCLLLKRYNQTKQEALKKGGFPREYLRGLNQKLAGHSAKITHNRLGFLQAVGDKLKNLGLGELTLKIKPHFTSEVSLEELEIIFLDKFEKELPHEMVRKRVLIGAHRQDLELFFQEKNALYYASTGQRKRCIHWFTMAASAWLYERTGKNPLWLLDDVSAELDQEGWYRVKNLMEKPGQKLMTLLPHQVNGLLDPRENSLGGSIWEETLLESSSVL